MCARDRQDVRDCRDQMFGIEVQKILNFRLRTVIRHAYFEVAPVRCKDSPGYSTQ